MKLSGMLIRLVLVAMVFGFLFGFDIGNLAGALPFITSAFALSPETKGLISSAVPLGAVAGVLIAALYSDALGRRHVLLACSAVFIVGSLLSGLSENTATLTVARLLVGAAIGASSMTAPMLLAELAPTSIRGAVVSGYQLMITIGITCAYLTDLALSGASEWRWMLGLGAVPAIIAFIGVVTSPDSPRWLILCGRSEEARTVLARLYPERSGSEIASQVADISDRQADTAEVLPWSIFAERKVRRVLVFCMMMSLLQQLSGINAVLYYTPDIMASAGMSGITAQLVATVGVGMLNIVMTLAAMLVVDRLGRRPLLLVGFAGTTASLLVITVTLLTPHSGDSMLAVLSLFVFVAFFALALGPLPWVYMAELFPMRLKTRGMALATTVNWTMNFTVVLLFPILTAALGNAMTFALFAGFCLFGLAYALRYAPETRGKTLEDMEELLA